MPVSYSGDVLKLGVDVLKEEAKAIVKSASHLDSNFVDSVEAILRCQGRVVVTGVGKSGHVARKTAATLASTGTPAFFVHAGEAGHGDLGMLTENDVLLAVSNSGETDEVTNFVTFAKRYGVRVISLTGNPESKIAKQSDWHINAGVEEEACPLGVAPTSSTTVQLALGDALAMAVLAKRGFSTEDFARTHPLGSLGRKYFLRVKDVMDSISTIPHRSHLDTLKDVIPAMAIGRAGAVVLLDSGTLKGIFTDSDLRRLVADTSHSLEEKFRKPINELMTINPLTIDQNMLASDALRIFEQKRISRIVCVEGSKAVGLLAWHNLLEHKVS
jgi:arabinose-5-phosphate isomerase